MRDPLLICGQERSGTALIANGVSLDRSVTQDPPWSWELVCEAHEESASVREKVRRFMTEHSALKCPSWVFLVEMFGQAPFGMVVFLQRDIRDQVCSLVQMMRSEKGLEGETDWRDPLQIWGGDHGSWLERICVHWNVDLDQPVKALAQLWVRYARAGKGLRTLHYETFSRSPGSFVAALSEIGVRLSLTQARKVLSVHSHGRNEVIRGVGRWRSDLPPDVAAELMHWQHHFLNTGAVIEGRPAS